MDENTAKFVERLKSIEPGANSFSVIDDLTALTEFGESLPDPTSVFPAVFEFLEANPDAELGEPGPLVHFVERSFPGGYEGLLVKSLERRPTRCTLTMANRLLNSDEITLFLRSRLLEALRLAAENESHSEAVRLQAADFLEFQETRGSGQA